MTDTEAIDTIRKRYENAVKLYGGVLTLPNGQTYDRNTMVVLPSGDAFPLWYILDGGKLALDSVE